MSSAEEDVFLSDNEEMDTTIVPSTHSRSNSILSHTSRALVEEEGQTLRAGHKFRRNLLKPEHYGLLTSTEEIKNDPAHAKLIVVLLDELSEDDEELRKKVREQGAVRLFQEDRELIMKRLRDKDPLYWESFIEAQEKARANLKVGTDTEPFAHRPKDIHDKEIIIDEQAISD